MRAIRTATKDDFGRFIDLAREVEPLFGPMADDPGFLEALNGAIAGGAVFCAACDDAPDTLQGAIVVDFAANAIAWLAVAKEFQGTGRGNMLLRHALGQLDSKRPVRVTTFADRTQEAMPARKLYERNGFVEREPGEINPAGFATVVMEYAAP